MSCKELQEKNAVFWSGCEELQKTCSFKELQPIFVIAYNHTHL